MSTVADGDETNARGTELLYAQWGTERMSAGPEAWRGGGWGRQKRSNWWGLGNSVVRRRYHQSPFAARAGEKFEIRRWSMGSPRMAALGALGSSPPVSQGWTRTGREATRTGNNRRARTAALPFEALSDTRGCISTPLHTPLSGGHAHFLRRSLRGSRALRGQRR